MSLETLIAELKKIYDTHPNAGARVDVESPELGSQTSEIGEVRYDHVGKAAVIEL